MFLRRAETASRIVATACPVALVNRSSGSAVRLPSVVMIVLIGASFLVGVVGPDQAGWRLLFPACPQGAPATGAAGCPGSRAAAGGRLRRRGPQGCSALDAG